jgi:anti-anti-sigma factor
MDAVLVTALEPPAARLRVAGDLDLAGCEGLRRSLADLAAAVAGTVTLDLSGVTFIDCTCLRVLDEFRRQLEEQGRQLVIEGASPRFDVVCRLAQYDQLAALHRLRSA